MDRSDPASQAKVLLDSIQNGGCVCWITNTVARAQQIYKAVLESASSGIDTLLIHSRYTVQERTRDGKRFWLTNMVPMEHTLPEVSLLEPRSWNRALTLILIT